MVLKTTEVLAYFKQYSATLGMDCCYCCYVTLGVDCCYCCSVTLGVDCYYCCYVTLGVDCCYLPLYIETGKIYYKDSDSYGCMDKCACDTIQRNSVVITVF